MDVKRVASVTGATVVALGIGLSALTTGAGMAAADPGRGPVPCGPGSGGQCGPGGPGGPGQQGRGGPGGPPPPVPGGPYWGARGMDQGRIDHRPFNYNGNRVEPIFRPEFNDWGFRFFGIWIPL